MSLLKLQDLGKIYVSDGNVTVGIRGVNLSFERGEFVAVTGKSGSGKSTLLNVISGMDSYEEGEMYIEGQTTSHYLQPEWEQYREKYISFIFQDYNIIESFTVLQNVELALMHIEDKKERRNRAIELISRVGLNSHINHKGSKLSGGQKQRTVIARALAKDSPIILADEPTGNLDSATSKEIIELLKEVSKDKLLIVVTHNFDEVCEHATRHIRVFDGAIESDHTIKQEQAKQSQSPASYEPLSKRQEIKKQVKNGLTLGKTIFTAKPKLSVFLCFLMIVGILGIFGVTTLCGEGLDLFEPHYMFNHIDGRVVIAKPNSQVVTENEVKELSQEYGANGYLRYDVLLDRGANNQITIPSGDIQRDYEYASANFVYGKNYGDNIVGRYPTKGDEVFLYLPIHYQPSVGKDSILVDRVVVNSMSLKLVGVKYYYDNNISPECLFTEDGFRTATAIYYLLHYAETKIDVRVTAKDGSSSHVFGLYQIIPSYDMPSDKIYMSSQMYDNLKKEMEYNQKEYDTVIDFSAMYYNYNFNYGYGSSTSMTFSKTFDEDYLTDKKPQYNQYGMYDSYNCLYISDELLCEIAEEVLNNSYKQASLFFKNDKEAKEVAEKLQDLGYLAVPSNTTYEPSAEETILNVMASIMMGIAWILSVVFLAFFINLCSSRALSAFKGDMAIMRSMGIQVKVIRTAMYVRMLISLIPAIILLAITAIVVFVTPQLNEYFVYLYAWQYALIVIGMLILTVRITHKQIDKLFSSSVKKSLKGGRTE
ncbi:MAG: ATP-binding cassette domain-containing protein [Clostridia bacterium]|nr:ATP-binding cassette domain-containing protein [Clostridia bacterium]